MASVLEALAIEIGLDASAFVKGQKEVVGSLGRTKDAADKASKDVSTSAKGMTEGLSKATQGVFDLMAAFLGGRGLKEFVQDAEKANTALGNLGAGLGSSPQLISAWGMAAQRMGGNAAATQASIQSLSDSLVDLRTQGKALPDTLFQLQARSGQNVDFQHGWEKMATDLANAASTLAKTDPAAANRFLRQIGLDPATAQLLIQQGPRMQAYLQTMKRLAPNDKDLAASREMTGAWAKLNQEFSQLATKIGTAIAPALEWLSNKIGVLVEAMSKWVEQHPKWTQAFVAFLAVLGGAGIISAINNVLALRSALVGLSAANAATASGGLLGLLARLGIVGAGAAAVAAALNPTDLNEGEDERARQRRYGHGGGNDALRRRGTGGGVGSVSTDGAPQHNLTDLISAVAKETAGGDPKMETYLRTHLEGIRAGESLKRQNWYDKKDDAIESSWGPFQLNRRRGMGVQFEHDTGLDVRDPRSIPAQVRWVAKYLKQGGSMRPWTSWPYHGGAQEAKPSWGDAGYKPAPAKTSLWTGGAAAHVAALSNISNNYRASHSSSSNEMHVGAVNVHVPAGTDGHGIGKHIATALTENMFSHSANYGPA